MYYNNVLIIITTILISFTYCQRIIQPHRAVIENSLFEARLPTHLRNPFYQDSHIKSALARTSWITPDERQVLNREAEKLPRKEIHDVLKHAGLLPQQRQEQQRQQDRQLLF